MKKLFFLFAIALVGYNVSAQDQTRFGLTAGYLNLNLTASFEGNSASENVSGFYLGALAEFPLGGDFMLQPSVNYGNAEDGGILFIPVMVKYYISSSPFHVQAGPQANFLLEDTGDEINAFGLDFGFGAGYDITKNFFVEARYAFEITNRISDDMGFSGLTSRINSLVAGIGYKF